MTEHDKHLLTISLDNNAIQLSLGNQHFDPTRREHVPIYAEVPGAAIHVADVVDPLRYKEDGDPESDPRLALAVAHRFNCFSELVAGLRGLLTVSLPHDVSGERVVEQARVALAKATGCK